jgi:hypothetical protein
MRHFIPRVAFCAALAGAAFIPTTAEAWWHGGVFIGVPPIVVGPPVAAYPYPPAYYYPPAYSYAPGYYPPGTTYAPRAAGTAAPQATPQMSQANTPYGSTCYAGIYTCGAAPQSHVGAVCSCPGIGAPSYGSVQ